HAAADLLDGAVEQGALFVFRQAHRLARVHRKRQGICSMSEMTFEDLRKTIEIDPIVARERRDRRMHQTKPERAQREITSHAVRCRGCRARRVARGYRLAAPYSRSAAAAGSGRPGVP